MIWLLTLPVRLVLGTAGRGLRLAYVAGRLTGYRRLAAFGAGVAAGLLVAPRPGREARAAVRRFVDSRRAAALTDPELLERVRSELLHHPRTWHLPQPEVDVVDRRVVMRGQVPSDAARQDLVRTAAALPGVAAVDDHLAVVGTAGPS